MIARVFPTVGDLIAVAAWILFFGTLALFYIAERRRDRRRDAWDDLARRDAERHAQCRQRGRR